MLRAREALYGGAAGGGKSDALLMAALQYVTVPGYNAIILRRTFPELVQASGLIPRSRDWIGDVATWREQTRTWVFRWGATLAFGHMQHERDKYAYKGGEYQFVGFDEVTHFSETQYRYMFSRLRKLEGSPVPLRVRSTANPEGEGLEWVKRRFQIVDGVGLADGRPFVPALIQDNPSLDREEYEASLAELDPVTRARLLEGDWEIREAGGIFVRSWFRVLDPGDVPDGLRVVRYWDFAATEAKAGDASRGKDPDWTVGAKVGRNDAGQIVVLDVRRVRLGPAGVEALVERTAHEDGVSVEVILEQEPGSSGVAMIDHYKREVLPGFTVHADRVTGPKELRWGPTASQAKPVSGPHGNVAILRGAWNGEFLDEMEALGKRGIHDDQGDALAGACSFLYRAPAAGAAQGAPSSRERGRARYGHNRARY